MDNEAENLRRKSEELQNKAATTLRRFGIVTADNEADQQKIDALCAATFKRVSGLSYQKQTPEQVQEIFGRIPFDELPMVRHRIMREHFSDPSKLEVDIPHHRQCQESTRLRLDADKEICQLLDGLHNELRKYEPQVIDTRPMPERLRAECFARVAELSGRSEKEVGRVYDRLDWRHQLPKDRNAEIRQYLSPELPQVSSWDPRRDANNQQEYERHQRALHAHETAKPFVEEATRQIIRLFMNLHGELNSLRIAELARTAEVKRIEHRIAQLQQIKNAVEIRL